jgi:hypothetical protein
VLSVVDSGHTVAAVDFEEIITVRCTVQNHCTLQNQQSHVVFDFHVQPARAIVTREATAQRLQL